MTNPNEPAAIVTIAAVVVVLVSLLTGADPIVLLARWGFALRRAIWVAGTMALDAPAEAKYRWVKNRPSDEESLERLEREYPAGGME